MGKEIKFETTFYANIFLRLKPVHILTMTVEMSCGKSKEMFWKERFSSFFIDICTYWKNRLGC